MAETNEVRWARFLEGPRLPATQFSGIRWQWQTDTQSCQNMLFAINWLKEGVPLATQLPFDQSIAAPVASATAQASGHQSEAMGCYC